MRDLVDNTDPTLIGVCLRLGAHAAAQSSLGANRPYCTDFLWTVDGTSFGDAANHTFLVEDLSIDDIAIGEGDINTVSISGIAYGAITMT